MNWESIGEAVANVIAKADGFIWGPPLMILLVGAGLFFTIRFAGVQARGFFHAIRVLLGHYDNPDDPGEISHFQALSAALSATIGLGNIAGVAGAVIVGGPGAIFWMWITALVGMATKFASCTLAVHYRRIDENGEAHGGPMYYIELGMGPRFKWLAILFAVFTAIASFGIGNMFQINNVMTSLNGLINGPASEPTSVFKTIVGLAFAFMVGLVIIGGIKSIARLASTIVPFMCALYVISGLTIIFMNLDLVGGAFQKIFYFAFHKPEALAGGLLGTVIREGIARGLFSNEAGLGSAAMAHGAARTKEPVREGLVAMLGPFIDTILICSITGLVIVLTGAYEIEGVERGVLTGVAFQKGLGSDWGLKIVSVSMVFFAFSTIITWSYYGNRAVVYLFGKKAILPYQIIYLGFTVLGAQILLDTVYNFCDAMNGLMALPNLVALLALSPVVARLARDYFKRMREMEGKE